MDTLELLKDIATRGNGDVYLGVVGPVRVGKSTFIKRFMETVVLNHMEESEAKSRAIDELPLSGDGKTIMTMEPKFIPSNAAEIKIDEHLSVKIRLIDCVGFLIDSASGYLEDGKMRMVKTPWFEDEIPFDEASKIGTEKVIKEHSTIGIVVLSDGTITDFKISEYQSAQNKVLQEMKELNKPYVIVLNSKNPTSLEAKEYQKQLEKEHNVPVILLDVLHMNEEDANSILKSSLYEFPITGIDLLMSEWISSLNEEHPLRLSLQDSISKAMHEASKVKDVEKINGIILENEYIESSSIVSLDTATGIVQVQIELKEGLYEQVLKDLMGFEIEDKAQLISVLSQYAEVKKEYDFIQNALKMANISCYGFAHANESEMKIEKPEIVKAGSRYGIKVKASVPTYHIIKVDVETCFEPIIGTKEQTEYFLNTLLEKYNEEPLKMLECDLFGRTFSDIINQGISLKLDNLPEPVKQKLQQIIKTISNKGKNNLIAFVF